MNRTTQTSCFNAILSKKSEKLHCCVFARALTANYVTIEMLMHSPLHETH